MHQLFGSSAIVLSSNEGTAVLYAEITRQFFDAAAEVAKVQGSRRNESGNWRAIESPPGNLEFRLQSRRVAHVHPPAAAGLRRSRPRCRSARMHPKRGRL